MIDIYTVSANEDFSSVWGAVISKTRCRVHTSNVPLDDNCWYDKNGDYVTTDAEGNIIPAPQEMELLDNFNDNYDYEAGPYLQDVFNNHACVLKHPNAIFILDIDDKTAEEISFSYGVICQSLSNMSINILKQKFERHINKGEIFSWEDCLQTKDKQNICNIIPSNSLVIVDRYLFTGGGSKTLPKDEEKIESEMEFGLENIESILKCLVPSSMKGNFNILLMFDPVSMLDKPKAKEELDQYNRQINSYCDIIVYRLQEFIKKEFPQNKILLEILAVEYSSEIADYYSETHDRRVLSNYYLIRASRNIKAFKHYEVVETQDIFFDMLCSKGLDEDSFFESDLPYRSHQRVVDVIKKHIDDSEKENLSNRFYQNGTTSKFSDIKNSILS